MADWQYPNKERVLINKYIKAYSTDIERDPELLFIAASTENNGKDIFTYFLSARLFSNYSKFLEYLKNKVSKKNLLIFTRFSKRLNKIVGNVSLLNINYKHGTIEIGSVWYCLEAQQSEVNTNVMYLIISYIFDELHYRRIE